MNLDGYNPVVVAVFAFLAFLVQIPVLLAQTIGPAPNMPIAAITLWFLYLNISTFINSVTFNSANFNTWWAGEGWCDLDTFVTDSSALGIMLAALVISVHLFYVSKVSTRRMTETQLGYWRIFDILMCSVIPVVEFIVHPFMTVVRYSIVQKIGCRQVMVLSIPVLIFHTIIPVIISVLLLMVNALTLLQFCTRGKESVYQALSFKEKFSVNFYWRTTIFCGAILATCIPLSVYNAIQNVVAIPGIKPLPWINGKPLHWDEPIAYTLEMLESSQRLTVISSIALKIMTIFLSFVSFFCFGTGSAAVSFYRNPLQRFSKTQRTCEIPDSAGEKFDFEDDTKPEKGDASINVRIKEYIPSPIGNSSC